MVHTVDAVAICCGILYLFAGTRKLYGWEWAKAQYLRRYPLWVYYGGATIEVCTGIGLLTSYDSARLAASIVQITMNISLSIHKWDKGQLQPFTLVPAILSTASLCWLAWTLRV
jgi:hypothetical protein